MRVRTIDPHLSDFVFLTSFYKECRIILISLLHKGTYIAYYSKIEVTMCFESHCPEENIVIGYLRGKTC